MNQNLTLQMEAFCELGITPEMAFILSNVIVQSEQTYSLMLILKVHIEGGKTKELLMAFIEQYEDVPRKLSEKVFETAIV